MAGLTSLSKIMGDFMNQISKEHFVDALLELGHNPEEYVGQKLSLSGMSELYEINENSLLDVIESKNLSAHYDYKNDTIWVDALEAAYFYFCVHQSAQLAAWLVQVGVFYRP